LKRHAQIAPEKYKIITDNTAVVLLREQVHLNFATDVPPPPAAAAAAAMLTLLQYSAGGSPPLLVAAGGCCS